MTRRDFLSITPLFLIKPKKVNIFKCQKNSDSSVEYGIHSVFYKITGRSIKYSKPCEEFGYATVEKSNHFWILRLFKPLEDCKFELTVNLGNEFEKFSGHIKDNQVFLG